MTAKELVSEIWLIGLMDPMATRMENAAATVERWGDERWQLGYDLGWKHCEDRREWYHVERNL